MTVVCIAGMHRSGTSMIARLLNLCGIYLGEESDLLLPGPDNLDGYWENRHFMNINDEILSQLGGGWDFPPPFDQNRLTEPGLDRERIEAAKILQQLSRHKDWGWKDPRNSITLPFWNQFYPTLKVVVCVRNPLEVMKSLSKRNHFSPALGFNLWLTYNERILSYSVPENRMITHYDSYFYDPYSELKRMLDFLELNVAEEEIQASIKAVSIPLRHNRETFLELLDTAPSKVVKLYQDMCAQAGTIYHLAIESDPSKQLLNISYEEYMANERIAQLARYIVEKDTLANVLTTQLNEKEAALLNLTTQLNEKEQSINDLQSALQGILNSRSWKLLSMFQKAGRWVAPKKGIQE